MLVLTISALPVHVPGEDGNDIMGYLVFRDSIPIGPNLEGTFHVVVPETVRIISARLDLYGTTGIIPASMATSIEGAHEHTLDLAPDHTHQLQSAGEHNHSMEPSGEHDHPVVVGFKEVELNNAKMTAALPGHNHTFYYSFGTLYIDDYDFTPILSDGHTHTAQAHGHDCSVPASGPHQHVTEFGGLHNHTVTAVGDHVHTSSTDGEHGHSLLPGWQRLESGTRPSAVAVTLATGSSTSTLTRTFGVPDEDWEDGMDIAGELTTGLTEVTLTSDTNGTLEYVLTVAIDHPYAVLTGHGAVAPDVGLGIPIWTTRTPLNATAYLFGDDLSQAVSIVDVSGHHSHVAQYVAGHTHPVTPGGDHRHITTEGSHTHDTTVGQSSPNANEETPTWQVPSHSHQVDRSGGQVTKIHNHAYGQVQSNDHMHTVDYHDHAVSVQTSGEHVHNLTHTGDHTHATGDSGNHTHAVSVEGSHSHDLLFSPSGSLSGGPVNVRASLDGTDITDLNGGPWALTEAPIVLELGPLGSGGSHLINLTSGTAGAVEWVVVLEMDGPSTLISAGDLAGTVEAHVPVPEHTSGAWLALYGSPYVMPLEPDLVEVGGHSHVTNLAGGHTHVCQDGGKHNHILDSNLHTHIVSLGSTVIVVNSSSGTVDLPAHTHTDNPITQFTNPNTPALTADTGTHSHETQAHDHELEWLSPGDHTHPCNLSGDHVHVLATAGGHAHSMEGGDHVHAVMPGVHHEATYPSPSHVTAGLGSFVVEGALTGTGPEWWDQATLDIDAAMRNGTEVLSLASATLGTVRAIVEVTLDVEPPTLVLLSGPAWVRPGDDLVLTVSAPDDVDTGTIDLVAGPVVVLEWDYDTEAGTIEFSCSVPDEAAEGIYDLTLGLVDLAGNAVEEVIGTLGVDGTPPTPIFDIGAPKVIGGGFLWVATRTPITLGVVDDLSGPGFAEYAFSHYGPWSRWNESDTTLLEGQGEGRLTLYYSGRDAAGNLGPVMGMNLSIDDTPPEVIVTVEPFAPGEPPTDLVAGPSSNITLTLDDGDGVQPREAWYLVDNGEDTPEWNGYEGPIPVSSVAGTTQPNFTISVRGVDLLSNTAPDGSHVVRIDYDRTYPIPFPTSDIELPGYANTSPLEVFGRVPGDVGRFLYRVGTGPEASIAIEPDTSFSFSVELEEGPNTVLYALEDRVNNTSPWVEAGTVILDTRTPSVAKVTPEDGKKDLKPGSLTVVIDFDEEIGEAIIGAKVDGANADVRVAFHEGNTTVEITVIKDLPGDASVELVVDFSDLAGNQGSTMLSYGTEKEESAYSLSMMLGMILAIVIAIIIVAAVVAKRRSGRRPRPAPEADFEVKPGKSVISPDQELEWPEGEGTEEEELEEEEEELEEEEEEELEEEEEELEEDEGELEEDEEIEERGLSEEPVEEGEEMDEGPKVEEEDVEEDLDDELDRLIEDARMGEEGEVEEPPVEDEEEASTSWRDDALERDASDLPDPDEETVDPGAR